ncbi:aminotransferase class I/II-fold pyridoxal phosphate-dependent enzyme [Paenirhodobacter populi]|uniref:aminotransferase class I/II-fold pyridoxal phosphate-dependent enzyme n=1 Tax=Paenirhodobacter populi TaxID=2306993 RepID=UPI00240D1162|nr:aminotransferase class I/II-fold pyridoxal phosphate-dependent enzyme [Sinirhodobacter populi]
MMNCADRFQVLLPERKLDGRYGIFTELERIASEILSALRHRLDGSKQRLTGWFSNDTLGMGEHPAILDVMHRAINLPGAGTRSARSISGADRQQVALEGEPADLHGKETYLIFTSGWISNLAGLCPLGRILTGCAFTDALTHNSPIEGIRRSGDERFIFRHNDVDHLEELTAGIDPALPTIAAFKSVFSKDGDTATIAEACDVAERYGANLDEVHASGIADHEGLARRL